MRLSVRQRVLPMSGKFAFGTENGITITLWFPILQNSVQREAGISPLASWSALHFPLWCLFHGSFYYLFFSWSPFFPILMLLQTQLERTHANFTVNWRLSIFKKGPWREDIVSFHSVGKPEKERGCDSGSWAWWKRSQLMFLPEVTLHVYGRQEDPLTGKCGDVPGNSSQSQKGFNIGTDCGHRCLESVAIAPSLFPVLQFARLAEELMASLTSGGRQRPPSAEQPPCEHWLPS